MNERETAEERPHARFGPSGMKNLDQCRGFLSHGEETAATARGTRIHAALEIDDGSELTDEDEYLIFEQCRADRAHARDQVMVLSGVTNPETYQELRLHIDLGAMKTFGTADEVGIYGEYGLLWDAKSGVSYIDAPPENWQSLFYVIGVFQKFPDVQHVFASFSVPVRHETPEGWYHRAQLDEYIERAGKLIVEAQYVHDLWERLGTVPVELLEPGDQCRYCLRGMNNTCPSMGAIVFDVVRRYDAGGLLPETGSIHSNDIDDPETLAKLYPVAQLVEKWATGIKFKARAIAIETGELPGFTVNKTRGNRVVSDAKAAIDYSQGAGLSMEELMGVASFSLGPLLDLVKSKAPRGEKQNAARNYEEGLEAFGAITRQADKVSLKSLKGGGDED